MPADRADLAVYQPMKSLASAKFSRLARGRLVEALYSSQVPSSAWAKPRADEGRRPLAIPKKRRRPRGGLASRLKLDSVLMIASCREIGVPQRASVAAAARYQLLRPSKMLQIFSCSDAPGGVVAHPAKRRRLRRKRLVIRMGRVCQLRARNSKPL